MKNLPLILSALFLAVSLIISARAQANEKKYERVFGPGASLRLHLKDMLENGGPILDFDQSLGKKVRLERLHSSWMTEKIHEERSDDKKLVLRCIPADRISSCGSFPSGSELKLPIVNGGNSNFFD